MMLCKMRKATKGMLKIATNAAGNTAPVAGEPLLPESGRPPLAQRYDVFKHDIRPLVRLSQLKSRTGDGMLYDVANICVSSLGGRLRMHTSRVQMLMWHGSRQEDLCAQTRIVAKHESSKF